jgi:hypothetical protein
MCHGPSETQKTLETEEANFYASQIKAYQTAYDKFQVLSDTLNAQFAPILAKGPNQFGFSDEEVNNLNAIATEGNARNYAKAKQALQNTVAAQGGGTSNVNLTSGATNQYQEQLASEAAGVQSGQEQQIQQAGYDLGRNEWGEAVRGTEDLAAGWNPNSFSGSANNAAGTANSEANTLISEQNSIWGSVLGALGGIGGMAASSWVTKHA